MLCHATSAIYIIIYNIIYIIIIYIYMPQPDQYSHKKNVLYRTFIFGPPDVKHQSVLQ